MSIEHYFAPRSEMAKRLKAELSRARQKDPRWTPGLLTLLPSRAQLQTIAYQIQGSNHEWLEHVVSLDIVIGSSG